MEYKKTKLSILGFLFLHYFEITKIHVKFDKKFVLRIFLGLGWETDKNQVCVENREDGLFTPGSGVH